MTMETKDEHVENDVSRRSVLKGALTLGAVAAGGGLAFNMAPLGAAGAKTPARKSGEGSYTVGSDEKEFCYLPALVLADMVRKKKVSPVEVMQKFLDRIYKINPQINAFVTLVPEMATEAAKKAESAVMKKEKLGPLHGIPVGIKDVTLTKGIRTTFGSLLYKDNVPEQDAVVVERLKKAGLLSLAKPIPLNSPPALPPSTRSVGLRATLGTQSITAAAQAVAPRQRWRRGCCPWPQETTWEGRCESPRVSAALLASELRRGGCRASLMISTGI